MDNAYKLWDSVNGASRETGTRGPTKLEADVSRAKQVTRTRKDVKTDLDR